MFKEANWNTERKEEYKEKLHQRQRTLIMCKNLVKFELKPMNVHNIPSTRILTAKQAEGMYAEFEDKYQRDGFPLTRTKDLLTIKLCIPNNNDVSEINDCKYQSLYPLTSADHHLNFKH